MLSSSVLIRERVLGYTTNKAEEGSKGSDLVEEDRWRALKMFHLDIRLYIWEAYSNMQIYVQRDRSC